VADAAVVAAAGSTIATSAAAGGKSLDGKGAVRQVNVECSMLNVERSTQTRKGRLASRTPAFCFSTFNIQHSTLNIEH
jgi:hypothetical protein